MIRNQVAASYAELNAFIQNHKASIGRYLVKNDETNLGNPIEYYYNGSSLIVVSGATKGGSSGGGLPTILGEVLDETLIETTYPTPAINDGVIVNKDSTQSNRRTWYVYDGEDWIYKGLYKGDNTQEELSLAGARTEVIVADTDYSLPNEMQYTVDSDQLTIMMNNQVAIRGVDWIEVGPTGTQSKKIQFKYNIPTSTNLVFRKDVSSTDLLYMQRNIDMDLIRKQTCSMMGVEYGGEIQYTTLREPEKVYWCNVNKKWYVPKFKNLLPVMTSNSQDGWILSHSGSAGGTYPAYYLSDNVDNTAWLSDYVTRGSTPISDASPEFIQIEKATPFHMNCISLHSLKNGVNTGSPAYSPKKVSIQGWNGTAWENIITFSDIKYKSYLVDGDFIPIPNNKSYTKYKIIFQSHRFTGKNSIAFSKLGIYSGKGSWTVADTDWKEYDPDETKSIMVDEASYSFVVTGRMSRNRLDLEVDLCRALSTETISLEGIIPPLDMAPEFSTSSGGYLLPTVEGAIKYIPSIQAATVRGWVCLSLPIKKEVRTYV